jgi:hypothetical protein
MKRFGIIVALLLLSFPAVKSLLPPGGYTSHDLTHHVARQIDMDKLLNEGQFPPRWSGDLNLSYGYPLFLFNYPTPAIIAEGFHEIGFNFVESVKAVMFVSMLLSVIGMYLFLGSLFPKQRLAAFLGSIFYLYAPIRFITVYVSASVGGALALGVLPFIFWSVVKLKESKGWAIPTGAISLLLLITSHNVTALMFAPVILAFSLILVYQSQERLLLLKRLVLMAGLGLGLSAFFWIPSIMEKKFIVYDQIMGKSWVDGFPTIGQLIHSPWGYGLAHPGVSEPGAMSFQVGLTQILVILILLASVLVFRKKKEFVTWGVFSLIVFLVSVFLMLKVSAPVWTVSPILYLVQYPFRFLAVTFFAAAVAATLLIKYLPFKKVVFVVLLGLVMYANRNHLNVNQRLEPGDDYYLRTQNEATSYNEHLPIWAYVPKNPSPGKLVFVGGEGQIKVTENKSAVVKAEINAGDNSKLRFNQFYFPGWELKVDGNPVQFSYSGSGENQGLPVFSVTKGVHSFEAIFTDTSDRKVANTVSLLSLMGLVFLILKPVFDKKTSRT